ncbi:hypothetical protein [Xanthobacter autotrophicus]|uniref:hypothetical protein n=1 Tax=Xanthobacter autotrophicus TaxID=280 RepID=UPI003AB9637A
MEGFFAIVTHRGLKHGVFRSATNLSATILQDSINSFITEHNQPPPLKPCIWRAGPKAIIVVRNRGF